jgi:hypothetical protein
VGKGDARGSPKYDRERRAASPAYERARRLACWKCFLMLATTALKHHTELVFLCAAAHLLRGKIGTESAPCLHQAGTCGCAVVVMLKLVTLGSQKLL